MQKNDKLRDNFLWTRGKLLCEMKQWTTCQRGINTNRDKIIMESPVNGGDTSCPKGAGPTDPIQWTGHIVVNIGVPCGHISTQLPHEKQINQINNIKSSQRFQKKQHVSMELRFVQSNERHCVEYEAQNHSDWADNSRNLCDFVQTVCVNQDRVTDGSSWYFGNIFRQITCVCHRNTEEKDLTLYHREFHCVWCNPACLLPANWSKIVFLLPWLSTGGSVHEFLGGFLGCYGEHCIEYNVLFESIVVSYAIQLVSNSQPHTDILPDDSLFLTLASLWKLHLFLALLLCFDSFDKQRFWQRNHEAIFDITNWHDAMFCARKGI